ncbi:MAG: sugar ABC transporter ATP-binding protein [Rectinemataceae bacterium]
MDDIILRFVDITKVFPGVRALDHVSMQFNRGEVHAIVGENGAGKSTLIKILSGAYSPTEGQIEIMGKVYDHQSHYTPHESLELGISVIYQEFNLIPSLSVAENIFFGREISKRGFIDKKTMNNETRKLFLEMEVELDPNIEVKNLSIAYQQIVEIIKSLSRNAQIIVMDEPTAPLTNKEIKSLFTIVKKLKDKGITVIYVSHRLEEVFEICDRVSVMRDGMFITTRETSEINKTDLIGYMIGREISDNFPEHIEKQKEVILAISDMSTEKVKHISFDLHKGEILGFGGLVGSGRTETVRALFGADDSSGGEIYLDGKEIRISSPKEAIKYGIGLLPEDRKRQGLIIGLQMRVNVTFSILKSLSHYGMILGIKERKLCDELKDSLRIRTPTINQVVRNLSGGNQQKVVIAKWLATKCDILIFDEPTRGVDVGAKQEIYHLMRELTEKGKSIIMISSEMPELIGMSDRIVIMHEGRINAIIEREEFSQERILEIASRNGG